MMRLFKWITEVYANWRDDRVASLAAALAYYALFSLTPILLICIMVASVILGDEVANQQVLTQINNLVGKEAALEVQQMLKNGALPQTNLAMQIITLAILLFSASGIFSEIQAGLNIIWGVQANKSTQRFAFITSRLLSFSMVLICALLLLFSLVVTSSLAALSSYIPNLIGIDISLELKMSYLLSFLIATLLFAMMFKHLPDVKLQWRNVWIGALITSLLFSLGKILIGFYLSHAHIASVFGAAGSLIILLVWVYYSAQIFFLGAEITKIYFIKKNLKITPTRNARCINQ